MLMRMMRSGPLLLLAISAVALAQRPAFDAFEVATVKAAEPGATGRYMRMITAHEFTAHNHAVKTLIAAAYNLSPKAITGGPAWVDSDRWEILAKAPADVRPNLDEQMAMLRKLLEERFQLRFHREPKDLSIYALTVAKGGPKLADSEGSPDATPQGPPPLIFVLSPKGVSLPARHATMGDLASVMQRAALDRPVVDRTGLTGRYDFTLEWSPDETQFDGLAPRDNGDAAKPGLFAAIRQQLGLKLEATRGQVDVLVIDGVKPPREN
jgi:uncharacterized protein (TIGR03435 family)